MPFLDEVSVVIPVHNGAAFVCEAIDSVFEQHGASVEVIVVDNNSSDGTSGVVKARYGDRVRVFSEARPGAAYARNTGASAASCPWLAFLDADDLWLPCKLERQLVASRESPHSTLLFTLAKDFIDAASSRAQGERLIARPDPYPCLGASSLLLRTSTFRSIGDLPPVPHGEFIAWIGWARELGHRELVLPEVLMRRRIHAQNTTRIHSDLAGYPAAMKWLLDRRRERRAVGAGDPA
jgi:glycosyltransferase involved in cell wall biosynthesis